VRRIAVVVMVALLAVACSSSPSAGAPPSVDRNVTFAPGLAADIYKPGGAGRHPAVLLVHGGGFTGGARQDMGILAEAAQRRGMVAATIDYRLSQGNWFPATRLDEPELIAAAGLARQDTLTALGWLKGNAGRLGIDPDQIVIAGYSAGAITVIEVASHGAPVRAAVAVAGAALDNAAMGKGDPKLVLFHGTADNVIPMAFASATCQTAQQAGEACELHQYPGEGHGILAPHVDQIADAIANLSGASAG
jgi:acetyl esterase/lipase